MPDVKARLWSGWDTLRRAQELIAQQAEDEGLWFEAQTMPEAYLQQELRKLHTVVENKSPEVCAIEALEK